MSQFSTSPESQVSDKAACLTTFASASLWALVVVGGSWAIDEFIVLPAWDAALEQHCSSAINSGVQGAAYTPPLQTVPLGNTGTTSTTGSGL